MKNTEATRFVDCLEKTIKFLNHSKESPYTNKTPQNVTNTLNKAIIKLKENKPINKPDLKLEFAPTSSIQEIAIDNGWGEKYLQLSEEFDSLIAEI